MSLLEAKNVSKSYSVDKSNVVKVLTDVSLEISESEMISIIGASGSGKSTLLHLLGGLDKPDRGSILYKNIDISKYNKAELANFRNQELGFVFQFHHLMPEFTALENVSMPALIAGKSIKETKAKASELLDKLGIGNRLHHRPSELSGGEQQRVAVARAFINQPSIIMADEPTGNLDEANTEKMLTLFFDIVADYKTSLILVTHDHHIAKQCNRTLHLTSGKVQLS